jgi:enterochelin esterase-like enzyme
MPNGVPYDGSSYNNDLGPGAYPSNITHGTYFSSVVNAVAGYSIYLPPEYATNPNQRFNVIYFLTGQGFGSGATENSEVTNDPELISNLQLIPPTIMVFPNPYQNSKYMDAAPGSPMSGIEMFESQFVNELIPFIDANYRTRASRDGRAIMGFSGGGQGALHLAFKYPAFFSSVEGMSSAVDDNASNVAVNEPQLLAAMFNGDANAFDVQTANGQAKADRANIIASGLAIHMSVGSADALLSDNEVLDALLTSQGISHDPLEVIPGGIHDPRTIFNIIGPTPFQFINAHFLDTPPAVTVSNLIATHGQSFASSSLFTASDPDGDAIAQYDFWNSGTGGGHFLVNGQTLGAKQDNYVSSAQLAQTTYQSGSGMDTLWVRVSDGGQWSPWSQGFTVTAPVDTGPVVAPITTNVSASHNQSFAVSSLFTASDPFGDAITQYDFWNAGTGGGHFLVNGQALGAKQDNYVSAAQLAQTTYVSGSGADTLWVRVSDGPQWSPWSQGFTVTAPVDSGPVVTSVSNIQTTAGQIFAASSLFRASDPFGDAITQYDFWNAGTGGGHFLLNNQTLGANQDNYVSSAQLAQTTYVSGSGADTLWVRVSDGAQWSPWSPSFTVSDPTTIGAGETRSHTANIALLGNYMASTFVTSRDGHGGTNVVDPSATGTSQTSFLVQPHHT